MLICTAAMSDNRRMAILNCALDAGRLVCLWYMRARSKRGARGRDSPRKIFSPSAQKIVDPGYFMCTLCMYFAKNEAGSCVR